jgi:hypothetical protein
MMQAARDDRQDMNLTGKKSGERGENRREERMKKQKVRIVAL